MAYLLFFKTSQYPFLFSPIHLIYPLILRYPILLSIAVALIPIITVNSLFVIFVLCLISDKILSLVEFKPCFLVTALLPTLLPTKVHQKVGNK